MCSNKCRLIRQLLNSRILSATNIYVPLHFISFTKQVSDTHHARISLVKALVEMTHRLDINTHIKDENKRKCSYLYQ